MKKKLSIVLLALCLILSAYSQTYYYQLNKRLINNEMDTQVSGGQFISFIADICYESTRNGMNVGHGKLTKKSANTQFKEYKGDSYWGTATFKFKSDLSKLNVITSDGEVWVYTRTTAPASATTCSLIRGRREGRSDSNNGVGYPPSQTVNVNVYENSSSGITCESGSQKQTGTWVTETCTSCNGTGKSVAKVSAPYYGGTRTKTYCATCGDYDYPHSHKTCGICNGKGYVKRYKH